MELQLALSGEPLDPTPFTAFSGIGLLRGEYICRQLDAYVTTKEWEAEARSYLTDVARAFAPRPVWYRLCELECAEINVLSGADHIIDGEANPALGLRGIRRGVLYRDTLTREIEVICDIASSNQNINILIPFVSDPSETAIVAEILDRFGFGGEIGMMAEIPSALLQLPQFLKQGIRHVTVGMNDLTSLVLGAARGTPYADFSHPSVLGLLAKARAETAEYGARISVAGYYDKALFENARSLGFDAAVMHYSMLSRYIDGDWSNLPHIASLQRVKQHTRDRIKERNKRLLNV